MNKIREAHVAGMFYPDDPSELKNLVNGYLKSAKEFSNANHIAGLVSPHAGYIYSGKIAASAYKSIQSKKYKNVIVISPSHREYFKGVSVYSGDAYRTPLGLMRINNELRVKIINTSDDIFESDKGHGAEHALEVQLPFLQVLFPEIQLLPLVIGSQSNEINSSLAESLAKVVDDETLIVASSDLSHFYPREHAKKIDSLIVDSINAYNYEELQNDLEVKRCEACGGGAIVALLKALRLKSFSKAKVIEYSDSGYITKDESEVVGYLSAIVYN